MEKKKNVVPALNHTVQDMHSGLIGDDKKKKIKFP